jgi:PST family polysaccharide transporter
MPADATSPRKRSTPAWPSICAHDYRPVNELLPEPAGTPADVGRVASGELANAMAIDLSDPQAGDVSARIRGGLRWKFLSETVILISRLGIAILLARLLTPREFGIAGMALVIANLVVAFADIGVGTALVQRRTINDTERSTMFWLSVAAGTFFTLAGIGLSFAVGSFYGEPQVTPLFMVFSLGFVLTSLSATQRTLLYRAMDFRRLELRTVVGVLAGVVAGLTVALLGFGPWALIVQSLTVIVVSTVLLWLLVPWRPQFLFDRHVARELGAFGLRSVGASLFTISTTIVDKVLIGRFLGATPLGVYNLAFNTVLMPLTRVVVPIAEVFYPAISRLQDDPEGLGRLWIRMNRAVLVVFAPLMLGIMITAPDLVPAVFGERWVASVPVLELLACGGLALAMQSLNPAVLQAVNRPATALRFSVVTFATNIAAYAIGLHWGVVGVAAGFAIANTLLAVAYAVLIARVVGLRLRTLLASQAGVAQAAVAMGAAMLAVRDFGLDELSGHWLRMTAVLIVGGVAYILVLLWRAPGIIDEVRRFIPGRQSRV